MERLMKGMHMRVFLTVVFCLFSFMAVIAAKEKSVDSQWSSLPAVIDGLDAEWAGAEMNPAEDIGVSFAFRNDASNLYILFIFDDPKYLSSVDATGLNVYFSGQGKKGKDLGLKFIKKTVSADQLIAALENKGEVLPDDRKAELRMKRTYVLFESDVINKKKQTAQAGQEGVVSEPPAFRSANKGKTVVYEFRIPLSRAGQPGGIGTEPGKAIKLGFEWGGMTPDMRKAMMARRAAMGSRATATDTSIEGAVNEGSDRADLGSGGPGDSFQRGPKKYSFWVDVSLAAQTH
jgi:hypothetical protein